MARMTSQKLTGQWFTELLKEMTPAQRCQIMMRIALAFHQGKPKPKLYKRKRR